VSTMSGREEKVEFKLPAKLTQPLAAIQATAATAAAVREE
jgi:4-hydroxy-3-methylbut-2-en-1-yl diphosphate reductase